MSGTDKVTVKFQTDIPHEVGWLLERVSSELPCQAPFASEQPEPAHCYNPQDAFVTADLVMQNVVVCPKPIYFGDYSPNSGSHRILFEMTYKGDSCVIAIEHRERTGCTYFLGESIWLGYGSKASQDYFAGLDRDQISALVKGLIFAVSGVMTEWDEEIYYEQHDPGYYIQDTDELFRDRFSIHVVPDAQVYAYGCQNTPEASQCLVRKLAKLFQDDSCRADTVPSDSTPSDTGN